MPTDVIDLNQLAATRQWSIKAETLESPEDAEFRRTQQEAEAKQRRRKEMILFCLAILAPAIIASLCMYIIIVEFSKPPTNPPAPASPAWQFATSILTAIISAFIGYLTGKSTSGSSGKG